MSPGVLELLPCLALWLQASPGSPQPKPPLELERTIELAGVAGRLDHLAIDLARRRLYVVAAEAEKDALAAVDLDGSARLSLATGLFSEPRGVLLLEDPALVLVTNAGWGTLDVHDAGSFDRIATVKVGPDADNLRYDPRTRLVYVGYGEGEQGALAIVDAKSWKVVDAIALGGHPESFQFDAKRERLFVNVPGKREIAVVDVPARKVVDAWPVRDAEGNYAMAIQGADRRLFVACRRPPKLLVLDPADGRTFDVLPLSGDADDIFIDEASGRVFVSCGEGSVDVFRRGDRGQYEADGRVSTAPGARTCLFSPGAEKLYVAVPLRGDRAAEIRVYGTRR